MNTIKNHEAVAKFNIKANASLDSTKKQIAAGTLVDIYKSETLISQGYDDIQNDVMREFFGVDYYDSINEEGVLSDVYEYLSDLRNDFARTELELVNEE